MSSMFKKKGGLAFKPKAPQIRRPGALGAPPATTPASTATPTTTTETPSDPAAAASTSTTSPPVRDAPPTAPAPTPPSTAPASSEPAPAASIQKPPTAARTRQANQVQESTSSQQSISGTQASKAAPALPPTPKPSQPRARARKPAATQQDAEPTVADTVATASAAVSQQASSSQTPAAVAPVPLTTRRARPTAAEKATAAAAVSVAIAASTETGVVPTTESDPAAADADETPKKRKYTRRKPIDGEASPATARKPRAAAGTRKRAATSASTPGASGSEGTPAGTPALSAPKRARKERSVTPEDAETRVVDHRELKMEDLTKDLRIGKKFSRHDELVDRLREKRRQYRKDRLQSKKLAEGVSEGNSRAGSVLDSEFGDTTSGARGINVVDAASAAASVLAAATAVAKIKSSASSSGAVAGPQFEIIDGAIVVNQASLVHDRHAAAAAEAGELEEVEENDFTRQTTSNTYLKPGKLRGPNAWTEDETELFYRALSMFGTSFDLICKMFPGKSRRHIKMKFNREDKLRPDRITQALVGQNKVAIDVDEYMARTGLTLSATETIDAEYALRQAEHDAEQQRIVDEQAEDLRKKREALFGPRNGGNAAGSGANKGGNGSGNGNDSGNGGGFGEASGSGSGLVRPSSNLREDEVDETDLVIGKRGRRGAGRRAGANTRAATAAGFGV